MLSYIIKRVVLIIPSLILVSIIVFMGLRFIPGDIVDLMMTRAMTGHADVFGGVTREAILKYLGLDLPIHQQYLKWIGGILRGDFGKSLWTGMSVNDNLLSGLPVSLELGFMAIFLSLVIAIPVGVIAGVRPESKLDYLVRSVGIFLVCIPDFWLATMILIYPALWWNISPSLVYIFFWDDPLGNLGMVFLPALILGFWFSGQTMRLTRSLVIEEMGQDYVRTAWSKGLTARVVVMRHVLKNTLIPVVTTVGLQLPFVIGGAVVVESIFGLPGLGKIMVESINARDYTIISGINIILATVVLIANLLVDISYAWLDPRIHYD
jgi:peptide/nickel transport system permease protein